MKLPRRHIRHLAAGAAALPAASRIARPQTYPSRPGRIIVAAAAGGATDIMYGVFDIATTPAQRPLLYYGRR